MSVRRRVAAAVYEASGEESGPGSGLDCSLSTGSGSEVERLRSAIAQLMHTAAHDPLTGLPIRRLLLERLERELGRDAADGAGIAVLFVDLDNFKLVNDSLGHGCGDEVLSVMAKRLTGCVGSEDTASRFGGDEIVILHPRATEGSAVGLGKRILATLAEPIFVSGKEVVVSASVGVALCMPGAKSAEQLLREADAALYSARGRGCARLEQFNDELLARAERRMQNRVGFAGRAAAIAALRRISAAGPPEGRMRGGGRGARPLETSNARRRAARRLHSCRRRLRTYRQYRTACAAGILSPTGRLDEAHARAVVGDDRERLAAPARGTGLFSRRSGRFSQIPASTQPRYA